MQVKGTVRSILEANVNTTIGLLWQTTVLELKNFNFFFKLRRFSNNYQLEVVMNGTENDCRLFNTEISILDYDSGEAVIKMCFQPRPMDTDNWGKFCMLVSQEAMEKIWKPQENLRNYFKVSAKIKFTG